VENLPSVLLAGLTKILIKNKIKIMEVLKKFLQSRKFWIAMGSIFIPMVALKLNMSADDIEKLYYSLLALLLGQSLSDFGKGNK